MILANVAAAETLERRHQPACTAPPAAAKIQALREFLATSAWPAAGLPAARVSGVRRRRAAGARNHPAQPERAVYSLTSAISVCAPLSHFTSPIRRYADRWCIAP